jgi:hypothetical protein
LFSDLASEKNTDVLASLASVLKKLFTPLQFLSFAVVHFVCSGACCLVSGGRIVQHRGPFLAGPNAGPSAHRRESHVSSEAAQMD